MLYIMISYSTFVVAVRSKHAHILLFRETVVYFAWDLGRRERWRGVLRVGDCIFITVNRNLTAHSTEYLTKVTRHCLR